MKSFTLLLMLFLGVNLQARVEPHKIIGENDLVVVKADGSNIPVSYQKYIEAIGLMNLGCTATHIGQGIVLTAGHCFWAGENISSDLPCEDTTIEWGVREGREPYLKSKCDRILFAQKDIIGNDFAIMQVSPAPKAVVELDLENKPQVGDEVTIFSHPDELPLRWSKTCVVENNSDPDLPPESMHHKCDTSIGSSGAVIFDMKTSKVVALHAGGHMTSATEGMNYGTYLTNSELNKILKSLGKKAK